MLKRVHIKGYKSLSDVDVVLSPLSLLFGPNAAGKSNFLDALQLLSKLATSRTLREAFDPPYRGKPLESFAIGKKGIQGLIEQERLVFSIEADLELSDSSSSRSATADTGNATALAEMGDGRERKIRRPGPGAQSALPG